MRRFITATNAATGKLGLRAGVGCGVAVGYGYGAGFMLTPQALTSLREALKSKIPASRNSSLAAGHASDGLTVPPSLQEGRPQAEGLSLAPGPVTGNHGTLQLEKDVADLTKLVLRQQILLEDVQAQLGEIKQKFR